MGTCKRLTLLTKFGFFEDNSFQRIGDSFVSNPRDEGDTFHEDMQAQSDASKAPTVDDARSTRN
jgi:hypothetical protein